MTRKLNTEQFLESYEIFTLIRVEIASMSWQLKAHELKSSHESVRQDAKPLQITGKKNTCINNAYSKKANILLTKKLQ